MHIKPTIVIMFNEGLFVVIEDEIEIDANSKMNI